MHVTEPRNGLRSLATRPGMAGAAGLALLLALALLAAPLPFGDAARDCLQWQRASLAAGEWWRLASAHFVHLGTGHALGNMAGLVLLWLLFARLLTARAWCAVLLASVAAIDAGLWWLVPGVQWYMGLSGVLHGIWAAGAAEGSARRDGISMALLAALAFKLVFEQAHGAGPWTGGLPVVTEAHGYGAVGGLLAWRMARFGRQARKPL